MRLKFKKSVLVIIIILTCIIISIFCAFYYGDNDKLEVGKISNISTSEKVTEEELVLSSDVFLKVFTFEKSKSIFIDTGEKELLYNTGNKDNVGYILENIEGLVNGSLDIVIASNSDTESYEGYTEIAKRYMVDKTIYGKEENTQAFNSFLNAAKEQGNFTNDKDEDLVLTDNVVFSIFDVTDNDQIPGNNSVIGLLQVGNTNVLISGSADNTTLQKLNNKIPKNLNLLIADNYHDNYFLDNEEYTVESIILNATQKQDNQYDVQNIYSGKDLVFRLNGDRISLKNIEGEPVCDDK